MAEATKKVQAALESPAFTSPEGREALEAERALSKSAQHWPRPNAQPRKPSDAFHRSPFW